MNTHTIPLPADKVGPLSSPAILKLGEQATPRQPRVGLQREQTSEGFSRVPYKLKGKSLRLQYRLTLQLGAIFALLVMLVLFRVPIQVESSFENEIIQQEIVQIDEVIQTEQQFKAPPPPRPVVPIEVPNDEVLEEEEFELDVALDIEKMIADLAPPALPEETKEPEINEAEIFMVVEEMPEIIGGVKQLYEYVTYPAIANKAGLEGVVIVGIGHRKNRCAS